MHEDAGISAKSYEYGKDGQEGDEREISRWIGWWRVHGSDLVGVLCLFELALGLGVAVVLVGVQLEGRLPPGSLDLAASRRDHDDRTHR